MSLFKIKELSGLAKFLSLFMLLGAAFCMTACSDDDLGDTVEDVGDELEDAGDEIEDGLDK